MNIQQEKTGDLSSLVRIQVAKEDYAPNLEKSLRDLGKKVQIKGFRPGKVPRSVVQKMYGTQVLAEELDKLVRDRLSSYLKDEDIRILGQPIPEEDSVTIDVAEPKDYEFRYELGLSPEFDVPVLSDATTLTRLRVEATDDMVDKEWERLLRQQGKLTEVTAVEAGDLVYGKFVELDETGEIKPGGLFEEGVINQDMVKDEALATQLVGMTVDQHMDFADLAVALDRTHESVIKHLLNAKEVDPEMVGHAFRLTLTGIKRSTPPDVTPEWLQGVFGSEEVKDEAAARDIIRREIERAYAQRTDRYFNDQLVSHFLENTTIPLPEEFLGRWLLREKRQEAKEGETVPDRIDDEEFAYFQRNLKWSLIYNKVARDRDLTVPQEELEQAVRADVHRHYGPAVASLEEEDVKGLVGRLMGDREYLEKVHGNLLDQKVFGAIHETITIQDEPTTLEAFEKLLAGEAESAE